MVQRCKHNVFSAGRFAGWECGGEGMNRMFVSSFPKNGGNARIHKVATWVMMKTLVGIADSQSALFVAIVLAKNKNSRRRGDGCGEAKRIPG